MQMTNGMRDFCPTETLLPMHFCNAKVVAAWPRSRSWLQNPSHGASTVVLTMPPLRHVWMVMLDRIRILKG